MSDLTQVPSTDPVEIYRQRDGLYGADLITAALVHFDFFSWLEQHPSTREEIEQHFEFQPRPTDVMLTLFKAHGYLSKDEDRYIVTSLAKEHLCSDSPWCIAPYFASLKNRPVVLDFVNVLKNDRPANWSSQSQAQDWHQAMLNPDFATMFTAAMDCRGHYLAQALAKKLDLGEHQQFLDIGGGSAIYACSLVAHHPHLTGAVLDQAPVDQIAEQQIQKHGFADCISVISNDMFGENTFPEGFDVHLYSNVLHDWGTDKVVHLLEKSYSSLPSDGLLIIHDAFINEDKTGPLPVAEYSAMLMHATQGKCYSVAEYRKMLSDVGFEVGTYQSTAADRGILVAKKH